MRRAVALAALVAAACVPENGPLMEPGTDCMECHGGGGGEEDAVAWTIAGTWNGLGRKTFAGTGMHVAITDANGKSFTLKTNQVGNFYTREPVKFPLRSVTVEGSNPMQPPPARGNCNASNCHGYASAEGGGGD